MTEKLLLDATRSWKTTTRWSLRTLAQLGNKPMNSNAKLMLTDVALRLAGQYEACTELMEQVTRLTDSYTKSASTTKAPSSSKVIRAINQPVRTSLKQRLQNRELMEQARDKAYRQLHNLQVLHNDTYQLTQSLLDHESLLERFNKSDQHLVASTMEQVRSRHAATVETLADICIGLREGVSRNECFDNLNHFDSIVESFLRGRLSVQLLCDHYVALNRGKPHGGVSVDCSLHDVVDDAVTEAKHMCDANLNKAPDVLVSDLDHRITLIRPWVHHALVELLKNAMVSFVKRAERDVSTLTYPPAICIYAKQESHHLSVEIIDQGLGLKGGSDAIHRAFGFAQSSAIQRWDRLDEQQSYAMVRSPLQSLGVGLPLSRMMMRHFGGDVTLEDRLEEGEELLTGCAAVVKLNVDDSITETLPGGHSYQKLG